MIEYKALKDGEKINRCSAILANNMQCVRAGEYHLIIDGKEADQQICNRCKVLQEANFEHAPRVFPTVPPDEASSGEAAQEKKVRS